MTYIETGKALNSSRVVKLRSSLTSSSQTSLVVECSSFFNHRLSNFTGCCFPILVTARTHIESATDRSTSASDIEVGYDTAGKWGDILNN